MSFLNSQQEFDTPQDALAHHGVKGMKWGVRKGYTQRLSKIADRSRRVSEGKGSTIEKIQTHGFTTPVGLSIRKGGIKAGAGAHAEKIQAHVDRINSGKANVRDKLALYGGVKITDIRRA